MARSCLSLIHLDSAADSSYSFTYKNDSGAFLGPLAFFNYDSPTCTPMLQLIEGMGKLPGLPPAARETAILAVGGHFQSAYELYSHVRIATKATNLTAQQITTLSQGGKPDGLNEASNAAYELTKRVLETKGPVDDRTYQAAVKALGQEGTFALIMYIGLYSNVCVILNAIDSKVPEGEKLDIH